MLSEEQKVINEENSVEVLTAFNRIPYALINEEIDDSRQDTLNELTEICKYYKIYDQGCSFVAEGTNGDYIPATLPYKLCASLVNKEARFLFSETPDIQIIAKADADKVTEDAKTALMGYNDLVQTILRANDFEDSLLKAAKDCFIGKRVACLINFNEDDGVTVTFLPSTQFIYETRMNNPNVLTKFVSFSIIKNSTELKHKRIFKKKFVLEDDTVYVEEKLYDGAGRELEVLMEYQETKLKRIPVVVFLNDGLTGDSDGESEIKLLQGYESWYSKLANSDIDAERRSMNPVTYTVDMDTNSTKGLSRSAGSFWDLISDQVNEKASPQVGMLESSMNFSDSLGTTLKRLQNFAYDQVDVPNINLETMVGNITSGKALKAIYWPLIIRCKEKMKVWGPKLRTAIEIILEGSMAYPNCIEQYVNEPLKPVDYTVTVEQNIPIEEDAYEAKVIDLSEVEAKVMSRKAYMKKWRNLSDNEIMAELQQIAEERQLIEDSFAMPATSSDTGDDMPYPDGSTTSDVTEEVEIEEEVVEEEVEEMQ